MAAKSAKDLTQVLVGFAMALTAIIVWQVAVPRLRVHDALVPHEIVNPPHPTVAMVGDSLTRAPDWPKLTGCQTIGNYGVVGNTTAQIRERLPAIIAANPRFVVLMGGTNDALLGVPVSTTIANLQAMGAMLRAKHIAFVVLNPPPLQGHEGFILSVAALATVVVPFDKKDLGVDQVHLNTRGYLRWFTAVAPLIEIFCN